VNRTLSTLVAGTALFWIAVSLPARLWGGDSALLFTCTAALLCLVPALISMAWAQWAFKAEPEKQILAVFGGMSIRFVFVIGIGMVLFHNVEEFHLQRFWIWVIVFYLFVLALEVILLTRQTKAERSAKEHTPTEVV
jgi:hypothetical protein